MWMGFSDSPLLWWPLNSTRSNETTLITVDILSGLNETSLQWMTKINGMINRIANTSFQFGVSPGDQSVRGSKREVTSANILMTPSLEWFWMRFNASTHIRINVHISVHRHRCAMKTVQISEKETDTIATYTFKSLAHAPLTTSTARCLCFRFCGTIQSSPLMFRVSLTLDSVAACFRFQFVFLFISFTLSNNTCTMLVGV